MDHTTSDTLDQTDEEILSPTVSDEAIEAAAGIQGQTQTKYPPWPQCWP
jgi:hypothetical protein